MDQVSAADTVISVIGEAALKAGEAALIVQYPFLGLPVISWIWEFFLGKLEALVILNLQKSSNVLIIRFSEEANAQAASAAADKLKQVQDAPQKNQADIDKALQDFKDAYQKLIGFRTSSSM